MKTIVLIRHAKTESYATTGGDFNRQLTATGRQDAAVMAMRLKEKNIIPDIIVTSLAKRAAQTAAIIAEHMQLPAERIESSQMLYQCAPAAFAEKIALLPDEAETVFIIAHNPGITDFANNQIYPQYIPHIPTCGIVALRFNAERWQDMPAADISFLFFDYPKNIV